MNETKGYRVLVIGSEPEIGELIEFILARGRELSSVGEEVSE